MKYRTIVADPPWRLESIPAPPRVSEGYSGRGQRNGGTTKRNRLQPPYRTMGFEGLVDLPVSDLAEDDAHLYLWTINRYIPMAYRIAEAWNFSPVQLLTWCKKPKGILFGTYTSTTEFILFCRRGSLAAKHRIDSTWFQWPRSNRHSQKPDAFLDLVEEVSPGPYIELFARRARFGWDYWGNESLGTAEMPEVSA